MTTRTILEKLMEIERALQRRDCLSARMLVLEAQDGLIQLEREMIERQAGKVRHPEEAPPAPLLSWARHATVLAKAGALAPDEPDAPLPLAASI